MASSRAQEEKNAKAIRELMKLPANKQCFDCGQKGPVYANCSIGTFICTTCSGVHRELSHRCKSVSMSTFTSAEVEKLTAIGNENAQKVWHANWNPSEYPAPDGNDTSYLKKFLYMTYQERKFSADQAKGSESTKSPGSTKSKKKSSGTLESKPSRRESKTDLPKPEPLSNILGPNIPSIDVGTSQSSKSSRQKEAAVKNEAPLINLLDDSPIVPAGSSKSSASSSSSSSLMGDLMSLSVAPQPTYSANPFGAAPAAPAVDPQQLAALQNQVLQMQNAIISAKSQMTTVQEQIQRGQSVFAQLNPQQREQLGALMQRYQAMSTQFSAMNQQHSVAAAKLQQMQAAAAAPPQSSSSSNMFAAFGAPPANTSTMGHNPMYGSASGFPPMSTPSNPSLYGSAPQLPTHSSSSNLFASQPAYTTPAPTSNSNPFPASYSAAPATNGHSNSSNDLFAAYSSPQATQPQQPTQQATMGGFGAPMTFTSAPAPAKNNDFHPFG